MSGAEGLFEGASPRVRYAPAGVDFVDAVARRMLEELSRPDDPFALADALLLVPNRRSATAFLDAFARLKGGALLPPTIRTLGDLDDDPDVWGPEPIAFDTPPAIDPLRRRLELAALIRARDAAEGGADDPALALAAADDLCRLLDSAAAGEPPDWSLLPGLVAEGSFAAHWDRAVSFLQIITDYWPKRLAADGLVDPGDRRARVLRGLAKAWAARPPEGPVVIAGSTGSLAAVRTLMAATAALKQGVVVLPGLDAELDDVAWAGVDAQHPQFALKTTLQALGLDRRAVPILAGVAETPRARARRLILREALAPADSTADWLKRLAGAGGPYALRAGVEGLSLIEAASEEEEAQAAALLLREALETPGRTAALVTPDQGLMRRVEAKLARWGVAAAASAGRPFTETPHGVLLTLLLDLTADDGDPIALASLLAHPLVRVEGAGGLRRALEGPRKHGRLADLAEAAALREALGAVCGEEALTGGALAAALGAGVERLLGDAAFEGADGAAAAESLEALAEHGEALGALDREAWPRAFKALTAGRMVADGATHPRIALWGPLEARLLAPDLVVLGGLNEGTWPAPPPEDGFLNRAMRARLGLPAPETRLGLAAHDFAQLAAAPEVVLLRAERCGGAPSVASRWLWRLTTLLKGAGVESLRPPPARDALAWARALDRAEVFAPAAPPEPRPPVEARLKRFSFTAVEKLIRDPYAIYARYTLGLQANEPIGQEPGARERGIAIHKALEELGPDRDASTLLRLIEKGLRAVGYDAASARRERVRLRGAAEAYVAWLAEREARGIRGKLEVKGEKDFGAGVLRGRADRIDLLASGGAEIIDVKTSAASSTGQQIQSGLTPQLPLEAAVLAAGGFPDLGALRPQGLIIFRFTGSEPGPEAFVPKEGDVASFAQASLKSFLNLLARYDDPARPYLCKPRVQFAQTYGDYDQLARRREWAESEE